MILNFHTSILKTSGIFIFLSQIQLKTYMLAHFRYEISCCYTALIEIFMTDYKLCHFFGPPDIYTYLDIYILYIFLEPIPIFNWVCEGQVCDCQAFGHQVFRSLFFRNIMAECLTKNQFKPYACD